MATCHICGAPFFTQASAWGDQACGDCIADRIELSLMRGAFASGASAARKPMRRAGDLNPAERAVEVEAPDRKVAGG